MWVVNVVFKALWGWLSRHVRLLFKVHHCSQLGIPFSEKRTSVQAKAILVAGTCDFWPAQGEPPHLQAR